MKCYADTSFLVKLVSDEADSELAIAEFRRLGYPRLFFTPIHSLEVVNAIRQRTFFSRKMITGKKRAATVRDRDTALARLDLWLKRNWLTEVAIDWEAACRRARILSENHTERLGCRNFDLLHVALAAELECELFLTADIVQAALARAESFAVITVLRE